MYVIAVMIFFVLALGWTAKPVCADYERIVPFETVSSGERSVAGVTFLSKGNNGNNGTYELIAVQSGNMRVITKSHDGGYILTNGKVVYYGIRASGGLYLRKMTLGTGKIVKYKAKLCDDNYGAFDWNIRCINIVGAYRNELYYCVENESGYGYFARLNLKTKVIKEYHVGKDFLGESWGECYSEASQFGQYFILGVNSVGKIAIWDAKKEKYMKLGLNWRYTVSSGYLYYAEITSGNVNNATAVVAVRKVALSAGKQKTLAKNLKVARIDKLTSKGIRYYDYEGKVRTKKW